MKRPSNRLDSPTFKRRPDGPRRPRGHSAVAESIEAAPSDPRLRILVAEVQVRCSSKFVADDATPHEERMTRQNARLRLRLNASRRAQGSGDRLVQALADSKHGESLEEWAARAALTWCAEAEVSYGARGLVRSRWIVSG